MKTPRRILPCIHFTGMQDTCKAGVNYRALTGGGDGHALRLPCITLTLGEGQVEKVTCEKQRPETEAEAIAREAEGDAAIARVVSVLPIVNAWKRAVPKGQGAEQTVECPICKAPLHMSMSPRNHHVAARCETDKCVSFIE